MARSNVVSVPVANDAADATIIDKPCSYMGYSLKNTALSDTTVYIRDGGASGNILDVIALAAGESARDWYGPQGIRVNTSLFLDKDGSVAVQGAVRYA